jgi:hypothetical protein
VCHIANPVRGSEIVHSLCAEAGRGSTPIPVSKIFKRCGLNLIRRQETRFDKPVADHPVTTPTDHGETR